MIDLQWAGMGVVEEGLPYFLLLGVAAATCLYRAADSRDSRYGWILVAMVLNFALTRWFDFGGVVGNQVLALATNPVPPVAILLGLADGISVALLLLFARHLLLSRVVAIGFAVMIGVLYGPAAVGWMQGGTALWWANVVGLLQLALIIGETGGGALRGIPQLVWRSVLVGGAGLAVRSDPDLPLGQDPVAKVRSRAAR